MARRSVPAVITFEDQSGGPPEVWPPDAVVRPPIYYPPEIWPKPPLRPSHPIVIVPPDVIDGTPSHPIVIPPEALPPVPSHPIVLPPDPGIPPGEPGSPSHPIVLPPLPPEIWPPAGVVTPPIYYPPEIWPKPPEKPPVEPPVGDLPNVMWKAVWTPVTGWVVILVTVPEGEHPTPSKK